MDEVEVSVWFSASIRLAVQIEGVGITDILRSVVVFKAMHFDDALAKALLLGDRMQTAYRNEDGREVRWSLLDVQTTDILGDQILDGREVYSEIIEVSASDRAQFPATFSPELSRPFRSGV